MKKRIRKKRDKNLHKDDIYIDNKVFTEKMINWSKSLTNKNKNSLKNKNNLHLPPDEIVEYFYLIGKQLLLSHRYFNYSIELKEDMLQTAVLKAVFYADRFDAEKFNEENKKPNAFTYFTTVINLSFVDTIKKYYTNKNLDEKIINESVNMYKIFEDENIVKKYRGF